MLALPGHSKQLENGAGPSNQLDSQEKAFRGKTEGKAHGGEHALHPDRNPVQRPAVASGLQLGVELTRLDQGAVSVHNHPGPDLVLSLLNSIKARLEDALAGDLALAKPPGGAGNRLVVNALPPLKVVQLLGDACLSPTTLAPKDPFRSRVEIAPHELFSLDSVEPHRVTSNDLVGALGAIPAAWFAPSHDVTTRLMFSSRADSFSPADRLHPHYQRASPSVSRASPFASVVCRNHHSFTYAASVA